MILPTNDIEPERALLTVGGRVLNLLGEPKTVSRLWEECERQAGPCVTFDRFVLAVDLLFAIGLVDLEGGRVVRKAAHDRAAHDESSAC